MIWEIEDGEVEELLALPPEDRAIQFFQLLADWEEAWGLKDPAGWVVPRATDALPLWPHPTFAAACAAQSWTDATPEPVAIDELLIDLLPLLAADGLRVAVFPSLEDPGLLLTPVEFADRLERELQITE
jgi:hypothetical protein